jgi:hypothetical protein
MSLKAKEIRKKVIRTESDTQVGGCGSISWSLKKRGRRVCGFFSVFPMPVFHCFILPFLCMSVWVETIDQVRISSE